MLLPYLCLALVFDLNLILYAFACACRTAVRGAGEAEHEVLPGTAPSLQPSTSGRPEVLPLPPDLNPADAKRMRKAQKKAAKEARRMKRRVRNLVSTDLWMPRLIQH